MRTKGRKRKGGESRPDMAKKVVVELEDEMVRRRKNGEGNEVAGSC